MTSPALEWSEHGPRSLQFGDVYFSAVDGLAESRAVFLQGCGLPEAFAGRRRFTVGELGFGTGLNILALLDLWRRMRPAGAQLHLFSVEAFPLARDEAARAHAAWPELSEVSAPLLAAWPSPRPGFHRVDLADFGARLDLFVGEAGAGLAAWRGRADAWFLDGFAPSKNPEMWREEVLAAVAARSAPGAQAATFTVAGAVRRGLEAAGFAVAKRPGFGRKKERLEARFPGAPAAEAPPPRVAVIGAGIAGAALARAFRALGVQPQVLDADGAGAGASGNAAALVTPRLDAGGGYVAALHAQAFDRAVALYEAEAPEAIVARGALQLEASARDADRFDRIAAWPGFAPGTLVRRTSEEAAALLGEAAAPGALEIPPGLTVAPERLLQAWLGPIERRRVARLERGERWRLLDERGAMIAEVDVVCVAAGPATAGLAGVAGLRPVRGQVSLAGRPLGGVAAAWGGYAIPTAGGLLFGATHDRDDEGTETRDLDHARNLNQLRKGRPGLAAALAGEALAGRASVRAATPDHLPLAGEAAPGLFVLAGLGGRGFTLAPLLAEEVAAAALEAPRPLPADIAARLAPGRFG